MRDVQYEVIPAICGSGPPPVNVATSGIHRLYQKGRVHYQMYKFTTPGLSQTRAGNPKVFIFCLPEQVVRVCLVASKFQKFYKISRHIEYLDACIEH
jgi:hypothetical protein